MCNSEHLTSLTPQSVQLYNEDNKFHLQLALQIMGAKYLVCSRAPWLMDPLSQHKVSWLFLFHSFPLFHLPCSIMWHSHKHYINEHVIYFLSFIVSKYSCFTMLCWFLLYSNVVIWCFITQSDLVICIYYIYIIYIHTHIVFHILYRL